MRNLLLLGVVIIGFNACTVTNQYKINSSLEFEKVPEEQRKTYTVFGKERLFELVEEQKVEDDSFSSEFAEVKEESDPFEPYNRVMTSFNDYLYVNILDPVARGYSKAVPEDGRVAIANFFHNITFPIRFVNNILQFKFINASEELGRFTINSTVGVLGFMDPAKKHFDLQEKDEDFGQTLGYYGFDGGPHIVLPLYGPSNLRDVIGRVGDAYINPLTDVGTLSYKIPDRPEKTFAITAFDTVNETSLNLGKYENLKKDAIDLYPFLKDIYTQNREKQIKE